jgi:hypothetical protein
MNPADDNADPAGGRGPVGSVAEEAAKLFAILQQTGAAGSQLWRDTEPADEQREPEGAHRSDCQWCPICQLVSRIRTTRPETVEHLAAAAAGVLGSLRSLLDAAAEAAREHAKQPEADSKESETRVDRIDVSEDPEPWD